jgi:tetratricopeptide (TPR) repeat protein
LHTLIERARFLSGVEALPPGGRRQLEERLRAAWAGRGVLLDRAGAGLDPDTEEVIRTDLVDLVILGADLCVRLAPKGRAAEALRQALRWLQEGEALLGPSPAFRRERRTHAPDLGQGEASPDPSDEFPPRTAWEHAALGRSLLRSGDVRRAAARFEQALESYPQDFWLNFYQGLCAYRLRRYADALRYFHVCVVLAPDSAECVSNRGLAYAALGRTGRALRDYDRALRLNPGLAGAAWNRGLLHYGRKRDPQALADLRRALANGADPGPIHYDLALTYLALGDRDAALSSLRRALRHNPEHAPARRLRDRLLRRR